MKASEIKVEVDARIETKTDAYYMVESQTELDRYVAQYGDVDVEYDSDCRVYRVPTFKAMQEAYNAKVVSDYARYGGN